MAQTSQEAERQVQVRFVTRQAKYAVTDTPINVPISLRRYALSEIVNHLLALDAPVPFDFLIDGQFIRGTLEKHIADKGLSGETVIELEYVEALPPPSPASSFKHDDWVSAAHANVNGLICTGCYDNSLSIWAVASGECLTSSRGHSAPIKAVRWVPQADADKAMCVTASQDCTLMAWEVSEEGAAVAARYVYKGHSGSVEAVAISPDGQRFASASFDHTVKLWSLEGEEELEEETTGKRQRTAKGDVRRAIPQAAYGTLTSHTNAVTGVAWAEAHTIYTSSWDHTIRQWDLTSGVNTHTMTGQKAISALAVSSISGLLASAGADRAVRIWDPRERDGPVVKLTITSHEEMTSCVAWSPTNGSRLVSGAYDGTVKVWDIRSNVPLHTLTGHEDKVLCADWSLPEYVISGGADNKLSVFNVQANSDGA